MRFSKAEDDEGEGNAMNGCIASVRRILVMRERIQYLLKLLLNLVYLYINQPEHQGTLV